jgi:hypothetical protein
LWQALAGTFETDLGLLDVIRLAKFGLELEPEDLHGTALDRDVVVQHVTGGGASVLIFKDQTALRKRLSEVFTSQPLADLGKAEVGECPPAPAGF